MSNATLTRPLPSVASWYSAHHGWLHAWLQRKLGCTHTAADLAQDTFLRILAKDRELADVNQPRAFLGAIAHDLMVNYLRRQTLERSYLEALAIHPEAASASPETRAVIIETLLEIDAMLDGLPEKVRQAFLLSQLDGLRYAEIADLLGVSLSMVKKYMLRAMTHCLQIANPNP